MCDAEVQWNLINSMFGLTNDLINLKFGLTNDLLNADFGLENDILNLIFGCLEVGWGVAGRIWGWIGGRGMGRGREEQGMGRWKV